MARRLSMLLCLFLAACSLPLASEAPPTTQPTATSVVVAETSGAATATTAATITPVPTVTTAAETVPAGTSPASDPTATATSDDAAEETILPEATETSALEATTTVAPNATGEAAVAVDDPARIAAAEPEDRDQVALVEAFKQTGDLSDVARTEPLDVKVGDIENFWVSNPAQDTYYTVTAKLRYAGPVALMYVDVEADAEVEQSDVERSAKVFEEEIYPRNRELFGEERSPGIDGDPRLTILNTALEGAGGYFSSADAVVKEVNRFSNEREMFVIGINSYPIDDESYASTLAHEFQHMIEWNQDASKASWFSEGMATLAEDLNGYEQDVSSLIYLASPDVQLNTWSSDASQTGEHYGTSRLFMRYFYEHYGGDEVLKRLLRERAANNLEVFAQIAGEKRPDIDSFADLYADWATANVLNEPDLEDGRYAYRLLPSQAAPSPLQEGKVITTVNQFGVDYLGVLQGPLDLAFDGDETVGLTGARPAEGSSMWWSNRGDESVQTLTRAFDLSSVQAATLEFSTWYEIEKDYDYGFVAVSTDEGETWTTLQGQTTTTEDPQGANLGHGLTGVSGTPGVEPDKGTRGTWLEERMDLTPYAGQRILLRFMMVQDAAYNAQGLLLDNIRIPEIDFRDGAETDAGWQATGFVRTTGTLPQEWRVRLIRAAEGELTVEDVELDEEGRASVELKQGERGLLAVMGTTQFTTEPATYSYTTGQTSGVY